MKILWIVNIMMPDACQALGLPAPIVGGWLVGYQKALLSAYPDTELHIIAPADRKETVKTKDATHHLFPMSWMESRTSFAAKQGSRMTALSNLLPTYFSELNEEIRPDAIHIHGTELPHSLAWIEACGCERTVVSIQGLASVIARYYMGGLTKEDLKGCWSINDWRFNRTLAQEQRNLKQRGEQEVELLRRMEHIAGRTSWDKAQTWAINPKAQYHTLQERLRSEFYEEKNCWKLDQCQRHSIFVSQSHYPIKGLHKLLQALPIILQHYPDTQLYIVGEDRLDQHWRHRSTYVNVIRKLVVENQLREHIHYLGTLTAEQMCEQYKRANLYVCPSAIENSCNSLCEAQLLGTPVVASYVGGLMDLVKHNETGLLYRFEEVEMLAQEICQIFSDDQLALRLSEAGRNEAQQRHDQIAIAHTLYSLYNNISKDDGFER